MATSDLPTREKAHAPNTRPKTSYLDADRLKPGDCDLEFRPPCNCSPGAILAVALKCIAAATVIPIVAPLVADLRYVHLAEMLHMPLISLLAVAFILSMMFRNAHHPHPIPTYGGRFIRSTGRFVRRYALLILLGLVLYRLLPGAALVGSLRIYVAVGWLMLALLADSLATHYVYWTTASPVADPDVLQSWRDDWRRRFLPILASPQPLPGGSATQRRCQDAAINARTTYGLGFVWLIASMTFPVIGVLYANTGPDCNALRMNLIAAVTIVMALTAMVRCRGRFRAVGALLRHWLEYTPPEECPPWVFQSPTGGRIERRTLLYATVAILSILMVQVWSCAAIAPKSPPSEVLHASTLWGLLLPIIWSAVLCLLQIAAAIAIVTGPVATTFHDLFEQGGTS